MWRKLFPNPKFLWIQIGVGLGILNQWSNPSNWLSGAPMPPNFHQLHCMGIQRLLRQTYGVEVSDEITNRLTERGNPIALWQDIHLAAGLGGVDGSLIASKLNLFFKLGRGRLTNDYKDIRRMLLKLRAAKTMRDIERLERDLRFWKPLLDVVHMLGSIDPFSKEFMNLCEEASNLLKKRQINPSDAAEIHEILCEYYQAEQQIRKQRDAIASLISSTIAIVDDEADKRLLDALLDMALEAVESLKYDGQIQEVFEKLVQLHYDVCTIATEYNAAPETETVDQKLKAAYAVLGLKPGVGFDRVKKAYRELLKRYHPDKNPDPNAKERCEAIINAYKFIKRMEG